MSQLRGNSLQQLYPEIWKSYNEKYDKNTAIPSHVWSFFHDLQLLQTAKDHADVNNVIWALGIFVSASKTAEDKRSAQCAMMFIKALRAKEHEAWYSLCQRDGRLELLIKSHPDEQSLVRNHAWAAKSAAAVAVILMDFQSRWGSLQAWQQDFMAKQLSPESTAAFKEAQQVIDIMNQEAFTFLLARQLVRAGKSNLALDLIYESPEEKLSAVVKCGSPSEKHSFYELYSRFLTGNVEEASSYLKHLVRAEAYSDESLTAFLQHEELKDVIFFTIQFVSLARRVYSGKATTDRHVSKARSKSASPRGKSACCFWQSPGKSQASKSMLMKISNAPHVLLRGLLTKYESHDPSGRELLLHDKMFQNALEVVLLLNESEVVVRVVERLPELWVEFFRVALAEWTRLHWLRVLEHNRPPTYDPEAPRLMKLLTKGDLWTWAATSERHHYFKSDMRSSEDVALVLWRLFEVGMFIDPTIIRQLVTEGQAKRPPLDVLNAFLPVKSKIFDVVASDISKRSATLMGAEVKLLMRQTGFYDVRIQSFLKEGELERIRAVFHSNLAFARLMQVVTRLFMFRDGQMDRHALESSLDQISSACHGDNTCLRLMGEVLDATLRKQDEDFLADGSGDIQTDPSAFTVAGLAACARRLRVACDTVKNQPVQLTFGKVVGAFLETPPRGWVPLFNSLETVLFFLRFMEMEDLKQAYEKFEEENENVFKTDVAVAKLLSEARQYYKEPFITMQGEVLELCNLDIRGKLEKAKIAAGKPLTGRDGVGFGGNDWNLVVDIAACAAESMKEKYNVPMLPHHTQMISLLMFAIQVCQGPGRLSLPRTILAKVGTGEGKSWIIGMLAAFVAKKGLTAHVIIDTQTLLERDFAMMSALFKKMKISAEKGKLSKGFQIVYCSAMDLELHFLDKMKEGIMDVNFRRCVMIVDEVDSLIVDENVYQCYVDDDPQGSALCEWWYTQGRQEDKYSFDPWQRKIMEKMEAAEVEMQGKTEGKHFHVDDRGMIWALDERTSVVKRSAWFLWLELMRRQRFSDYRIRYCSRQNVICQKSCFSSYSFIFGLTGSLGTAAEQAYFKKHFNASCFFVPPFLDTCRGTSRPRAQCIHTFVSSDSRMQLAQTLSLVKSYVSSVPILVVCRDAERVKMVVQALEKTLPDHVIGDKLGAGVIELLDRPGKETEFQQMVEVATQPLEVQNGRQWRVTATTAIGARGQDYHVSDELVDEKGGFLLVLEYVPDSEREWIQFLGRTARHDHPGQYAVLLNTQDYSQLFGNSCPEDASVVEKILEHVNRVNEQTLLESEVQLERGVMMHKYTGHFWAWYKKNTGSKQKLHEKFGQWVDLCDTFGEKRPEDVARAFEELGLPAMQSVLDVEQVHVQQIPGAGARPFDKGVILPGDWEDGTREGEGKMVWPNGQVFEGKRKQVEFCSLFRDPL